MPVKFSVGSGSECVTSDASSIAGGDVMASPSGLAVLEKAGARVDEELRFGTSVASCASLSAADFSSSSDSGEVEGCADRDLAFDFELDRFLLTPVKTGFRTLKFSTLLSCSFRSRLSSRCRSVSGFHSILKLLYE